MRVEYIVGVVNPTTHKVTHCNIDSYDKVIEYVNEKQRLGFDVIVVKKMITEDGKEKMYLEKIGYSKLYAFINKIFIIVGFMLLLLFSYLYYKFFKN